METKGLSTVYLAFTLCVLMKLLCFIIITVVAVVLLRSCSCHLSHGQRPQCFRFTKACLHLSQLYVIMSQHQLEEPLLCPFIRPCTSNLLCV